jgi:hypothetical protein
MKISCMYTFKVVLIKSLGEEKVRQRFIIL